MKGKHNGSFKLETCAHKGKKVQNEKKTTQESMSKDSFGSAILLISEISITTQNLSWVPTLVSLQKLA